MSLASQTNQAAATDTNKLAYALKLFFQSSEIKASLLLGSLPETMNNIVENLQTKDNLTYELAYNYLMDLRLSSNAAPTVETAYKAKTGNVRSQKASGEDTGPQTGASQEEVKMCSFCQKRSHLWSEYRSRKRREENKKEENKKKTGDSKTSDKGEKTSERAKVADVEDDSETALTVRPSTALSASTWVLDSGATSHMTSNPSCFTHIHKKEGYVKIGDGSQIRIDGVGNVRLTPNGGKTVILQDCLCVPSSGKLSLLSVRKCQRNSLHVIGRRSGSKTTWTRRGSYLLW